MPDLVAGAVKLTAPGHLALSRHVEGWEPMKKTYSKPVLVKKGKLSQVTAENGALSAR